MQNCPYISSFYSVMIYASTHTHTHTHTSKYHFSIYTLSHRVSCQFQRSEMKTTYCVVWNLSASEKLNFGQHYSRMTQWNILHLNYLNRRVLVECHRLLNIKLFVIVYTGSETWVHLGRYTLYPYSLVLGRRRFGRVFSEFFLMSIVG